MIHVRLVSGAFDATPALAEFVSARRDAGALASFVGYCRDQTHGAEVDLLELQHYPGFTEAQISQLVDSIAAKHGVLDAMVIHRVGAIAPGDAIVLVAALSTHRSTAFAAVEEIMDYLKTDAPIWKLERGPSGKRWVEPTPEDRQRRAKHGTAP